MKYFALLLVLSLSLAAQSVSPSGVGGGSGSGTVGNCATNNAIANYAAAGTTVGCAGGATEDSSGNISTGGTMSTGVGSGNAGAVNLLPGTDTAVPANSVGWGAPTTMTTGIRYKFTNVNPTVANSLMLFGAPGSSESLLTFTPYNIPATIAAHQVIVATSTTATVAKTIPDCTDNAGNHLNYTQSTDVFSCGTTSSTTTVATGTSAMGTSAISSGACATVVSATATGTLTTDKIVYTPNADPTGVTGYAVSATGSLYIWAYPTADHANFKVCNNTSGSLTPSALSLNWSVIR